MHLNSGLLLRRPGESAYAAARRFACANPALSYHTMTQEARHRLPDFRPIRNAQRSLIGRLAHQVEIEHCQQYGIPLPSYTLDPPNPFSVNPWALSISCNCPECARAIFHSPYYELPWLDRCPVHHCSFIPFCPTCDKAWPPMSEIWSRKCVTCGLTTSRETLINVSDHRDDWGRAPFPILQRVFEHYGEWERNLIWAGDDCRANPFDIYSHLPIQPRHQLFPSIVSCFNVDFRDFCIANQIYIEPCLRLSFACKPTSDIRMHYDPTGATQDWVQACRRHVTDKIVSAVAHCAGPNHHLKPRPPSDNDLPDCAFCTAFYCWDHLIRRHPLRHSESKALPSFYAAALPPPPQPLPLLIIASRYSTSSFLPLPQTNYQLPLGAQRMLYTLDLWTTFVSVFKFCDYHYRGKLDEEITGVRLDFSVPPSFKESISCAIAFLKTSADDYIDIYVPKSLLSHRLETKHSALWLRICTTNQEAKEKPRRWSRRPRGLNQGARWVSDWLRSEDDEKTRLCAALTAHERRLLTRR